MNRGDHPSVLEPPRPVASRFWTVDCTFLPSLLSMQFIEYTIQKRIYWILARDSLGWIHTIFNYILKLTDVYCESIASVDDAPRQVYDSLGSSACHSKSIISADTIFHHIHIKTVFTSTYNCTKLYLNNYSYFKRHHLLPWPILRVVLPVISRVLYLSSLSTLWQWQLYGEHLYCTVVAYLYSGMHVPFKGCMCTVTWLRLHCHPKRHNALAIACII